MRCLPRYSILALAFLIPFSFTTEAAGPRQVTPAQLVTQGGEALWDHSTQFSVRFNVHSVRSVPTIYPDNSRHTVLHLVPLEEIPGRHDFTVPISRQVEATLTRIGIRDIRKHFSGRDIEFTGSVSKTGLHLILSESVYTYHISLRSLDQIIRLSDPKPRKIAEEAGPP